MPEPLAKPLRRTSTPSIAAVAVAPLGKVSVVMIARAAASQPRPRAPARPAASAPTILSAGGGSPMTPVEEMNTSFGSQPSKRAAVAAVASTTSLPARPVKALALPELATMARTVPPAQALAAPQHRRARRQRAGEHAGDGAAGRQLGQHQIVAPGVADAAGEGGEPHTGDRPRARESARARAARPRPSICPPATVCRRARRSRSWRRRAAPSAWRR